MLFSTPLGRYLWTVRVLCLHKKLLHSASHGDKTCDFSTPKKSVKVLKSNFCGRLEILSRIRVNRIIDYHSTTVFSARCPPSSGCLERRQKNAVSSRTVNWSCRRYAAGEFEYRAQLLFLLIDHSSTFRQNRVSPCAILPCVLGSAYSLRGLDSSLRWDIHDECVRHLQ